MKFRQNFYETHPPLKIYRLIQISDLMIMSKARICWLLVADEIPFK